MTAPSERRMAEEREALALKAVRLALPILDDDLQSYESDTAPATYDKRGFVCLDDLVHCDHRRWLDCQATLTALAAFRAVLPADFWENETYKTTQLAVDYYVITKQEGAGT